MKEKIIVLLGSKSDIEKLEDGFALLKEYSIPYRLEIISAHRHPDKLRALCKKMESDGVKVVIACAGMAAALPGFIASYVDIPVIGVALKGGILDGLDALFSMVSIPQGLGIVSSGVGKSAFINAVISAIAILALDDQSYKAKLAEVKSKFR